MSCGPTVPVLALYARPGCCSPIRFYCQGLSAVEQLIAASDVPSPEPPVENAPRPPSEAQAYDPSAPHLRRPRHPAHQILPKPAATAGDPDSMAQEWEEGVPGASRSLLQHDDATALKMSEEAEEADTTVETPSSSAAKTDREHKGAHYRAAIRCSHLSCETPA